MRRLRLKCCPSPAHPSLSPSAPPPPRPNEIHFQDGFRKPGQSTGRLKDERAEGDQSAYKNEQRHDDAYLGFQTGTYCSVSLYNF